MSFYLSMSLSELLRTFPLSTLHSPLINCPWIFKTHDYVNNYIFIILNQLLAFDNSFSQIKFGEDSSINEGLVIHINRWKGSW